MEQEWQAHCRARDQELCTRQKGVRAPGRECEWNGYGMEVENVAPVRDRPQGAHVRLRNLGTPTKKCNAVLVELQRMAAYWCWPLFS